MANEEQLSILKQGVELWNKWRRKEPDEKIDLSGSNLIRADLTGANLKGANLKGANLRWIDLTGVELWGADLDNAQIWGAHMEKANLKHASLREAVISRADLGESDLSWSFLTRAKLKQTNLKGAILSMARLEETDFKEANLTGADLWRADLAEANLRGANLTNARLTNANLRKADLTRANLTNAILTNANLSYANLTGAIVSDAKISKCHIYGSSVWDLEGELAEQNELIITPSSDSVITVDNLEIAQFIYLILNNKKVRDVINTLTSKTVLILGRFALPERKAILDALRDKLREYNLLPIVFDFDRPTDKDFTETIKTLAGLSYFVIADVTNPKSSPLELQATVPDYQIPFVPIIQEGESPFAMMVDLQKKYNWVLPTRSYDSIETLMSALKPGIIDPAVEMRNKLRLIKAQEQVTENLKDYLGKTL